MKKDDAPVVVEATYKASAETVWNAITNADEMRNWYFQEIPAFEPEVGFETRFDVESGGRIFPHVWKVTAATPNQSVEYDWSYDGYDGDGFVAFEITDNGDSATLKLTCKVRETFQEDIPEFSRENCVAGWEYFIQDSLKSYLESAS